MAAITTAPTMSPNGATPQATQATPQPGAQPGAQNQQPPTQPTTPPQAPGTQPAQPQPAAQTQQPAQPAPTPEQLAAAVAERDALAAENARYRQQTDPNALYQRNMAEIMNQNQNLEQRAQERAATIKARLTSEMKDNPDAVANRMARMELENEAAAQAIKATNQFQANIQSQQENAARLESFGTIQRVLGAIPPHVLQMTADQLKGYATALQAQQPAVPGYDTTPRPAPGAPQPYAQPAVPPNPYQQAQVQAQPPVSPPYAPQPYAGQPQYVPNPYQPPVAPNPYAPQPYAQPAIPTGIANAADGYQQQGGVTGGHLTPMQRMDLYGQYLAQGMEPPADLKQFAQSYV